MASQFVIVAGLLLVIVTAVSVADDYPDYSIFWEGQNEEAFKKCISKKPLHECTAFPECEGDKQKFDDLKTCSKEVFSNKDDCQLKQVNQLITDYYEGYNEIGTINCKNETIRDEYKKFRDAGCWEKVIPCLALLEQLHQRALDYEDQYCQNMKKFLNTKCLDEKQKDCLQAFERFRDIYIGDILCKGDTPSASVVNSVSFFLILIAFVITAVRNHL